MPEPSQHEELFDPKFLGRLRALFFKLRKRRQLKRKGVQPTPAAGFTREFKDHRAYSRGDDFRAIDWRLFARLDRLFIRIFEEIQEFHVHIVIDTSMSMAEPLGEKRVASLRLAVALAYLGLISQHRVSIYSIAGECKRETEPLKGQGHIHEVLKLLGALKYSGATDLEKSLRQFRPSRDRRGIVFLISDLFGKDPELSPTILKQISTWPCETHIIHVLAPGEISPNLEGEIELLDIETGEARRMWLTRREMERYVEAFRKFQEGIESACSQRQIDYLCWRTDLTFESLFLALLMRGSALAGK